jgi:methyl-accepting chemotaxis protein
MFRRTDGVITDSSRRRSSVDPLDDAGLWSTHEQTVRSLEDSGARAERLAAAVARQRGLIEGAAERASLVAARSEGLVPSAARTAESFERLGVVALNAGLEGARIEGPQGRALLLISDEIRANVRRGADAAEQVVRVVEEISSESAEVRRQLEQSRLEVSEVGEETGHLMASVQQASKALDDLAARLRRVTGVDPETARAVAAASEHARGLMTALSTLSTAAQAAPAIAALRPIFGPLVRLLGEIGGIATEEGRGNAGSDP